MGFWSKIGTTQKHPVFIRAQTVTTTSKSLAFKPGLHGIPEEGDLIAHDATQEVRNMIEIIAGTEAGVTI